MSLDNYLQENRDRIFQKYTNEELLSDIENFKSGSGKMYKLLNHYFEEEMFKCKGGRGSMTPMEALNNPTVLSEIIEFTKSKPKFYVGTEVANIKSFFRNAGRKAQKVANFPVRTARELYEKYTEEGMDVYDPSCGFGSRMSACLLSNRNYFGTDPNQSLMLKLKECSEFILGDNHGLFQNRQVCRLYGQGSEIFIPELENTIDFIFTSPPYFDLEEYGEGENQSIVKFKNYNNWLNGFVKPTIENCYRYTKIGGHIAINIKNMTSGKKYKLFDDWFSEFLKTKGLKHVETLDIKQNSKREYKGKHFTGVTGDMGQTEPVMVFRKYE